MSATSTTWSSESNTKAGPATLDITTQTSGDLSIAGDLEISGGNITSALTLDSTLTVGLNDTGHDVKFFGATSGKYMEWDQSADQLDVTGSLDVTGNTTMIGTFTVGVDDAGHDVKFFGDTASNYMLWDTSADTLIISSTDDNECLKLTSTDTGSVQGPTIVFERNPGEAGADDDNLGACVFKGYNDNGTPENITFAQLTSQILDASDGTECGNLMMRVQVAGSGRNVVQVDGVGSVGNVTLGYGSASLTKCAGYFAANGATPAAAPNYTISNLSTDRALDCDSTSDAELADVLGQVITDLIAIGIFQ